MGVGDAASDVMVPSSAAAEASGSSVNLTVAVRCRPLSSGEVARSVAKVVSTTGNKVVVTHTPSGTRTGVERSYHFDKTRGSSVLFPQKTDGDAREMPWSWLDGFKISWDSFSPYATQQHIFESLASPVVDEVLQGFNCTVFAYGPTGTGKTHTMEGEGEGDDAGIITRCARAMFERLERRKDSDFSVRVSCLEVYNEEMSDLLLETTGKVASSSSSSLSSSSSSKEKTRRALRLVSQGEGLSSSSSSSSSKGAGGAQQGGGVVCANLEELPCESVGDALAALRRAARNRITAFTLCNDKSSRSHVIYCLKVCVRSLADDGRDLVVNGQLNLVDLAGSECVGRSGATAGRAREAGSINQSLLTLGRVITSLVQKGESNYVPYRDSKLTRLLQDSLGGRAKTTLIATVSPSNAAVEETLSTLQYALRARSIRNKPEQRATYRGKALLKQHTHEVDELQRMLRCQRDKAGGLVVPNEKWDEMCASLDSRSRELEELQEAMTLARAEKVDAERDRDDLRGEVEAERGKREAAEARAHEADEALGVEVDAHAATKEAERRVTAAHALAVRDGTTLRQAMAACVADLSTTLEDVVRERNTLLAHRASAVETAEAVHVSNEALEAVATDLDAVAQAYATEATAALAAACAAAAETAAEAAAECVDGAFGSLDRRRAAETADRLEAHKAHAEHLQGALRAAEAALTEAARRAKGSSDALQRQLQPSSTEGGRRKAPSDQQGSSSASTVGSTLATVEGSIDAMRRRLEEAAGAVDADVAGAASDVIDDEACGVRGVAEAALRLQRQQAARLARDREATRALRAAAVKNYERQAVALKRAVADLVERDLIAKTELLGGVADQGEATVAASLAFEADRSEDLAARLGDLEKKVLEGAATVVDRARTQHRFDVGAGATHIAPLRAVIEAAAGAVAADAATLAAGAEEAAAHVTQEAVRLASSLLADTDKRSADHDRSFETVRTAANAAKDRAESLLKAHLAAATEKHAAAEKVAAAKRAAHLATHSDHAHRLANAAEAQRADAAHALAALRPSDTVLGAHDAALADAADAFGPLNPDPPPAAAAAAAAHPTDSTIEEEEQQQEANSPHQAAAVTTKAPRPAQNLNLNLNGSKAHSSSADLSRSSLGEATSRLSNTSSRSITSLRSSTA